MQQIESAAFSAWPSAITEHYKGWTLRLDAGYTKRANSANAGSAAQALTLADIEAIEQRFAERHLKPCFRLLSNADVIDTDHHLIERGYRLTEPSLVMTRTLPGTDPAAHLTLSDDAASWLAEFQRVSGKPAQSHDAHLQILQRIAQTRALAMLAHADEIVCCGLAVLVGDQLGLFDIATHSAHRQRGFARSLCGSLLHWGHAQGARNAYVQVIAANQAAITTYERLGFRHAYHYWYRTRS